MAVPVFCQSSTNRSQKGASTLGNGQRAATQSTRRAKEGMALKQKRQKAHWGVPNRAQKT